MAENEPHQEPEITGAPSDADRKRVPLYPITVERKNSSERGTREANSGNGEKKTEEESRNRESFSVEQQSQKLQQSHPAIQQTTDPQAERKVQPIADNLSDSFSSQRVYKKSSLNNKLTLYLASRDLIVSEEKVDKLQGVLLVDPDYLQGKRVLGQITLTFRYGREDEEVMGLKFCSETAMCLAQLYPPHSGSEHQETTPLQEALVKRLGPNAHAFTMGIARIAPPSVQLLPAKEYNGAPIGTSYDVRAFVDPDQADGKFHRTTMVKMGIRVIQRTTKPPMPATTVYTVPLAKSRAKSQGWKSRVTFANRTCKNEIIEDGENVGPRAAVEKPFILSDGRVELEASLDRSIYAHGDTITITVNVNNNSSKSVRRIKVFVVQHVDVCMFSNGKFKNVVALVSSREGCPIGPGRTFTRTYTLRPIKGSTKNWIALEDSYTKAGATLASTVACPRSGSNLNSKSEPKDLNILAINVSYYVKVKLLMSAMGGEVSLKLPFTLMHSNTDPDLIGFPSPIREGLPRSIEKPSDEIKESQERQKPEERGQRAVVGKLEAIKEKRRESRVTDVNLIEHCNESESS